MVIYSTYMCLVGYLERRNLRCHENITNIIQKVQENSINMLFWCKEEGIEEAEYFLGCI